MRKQQIMRMAAVCAAITIGGCQTTQRVNDDEALSQYPQTGIEGIAGSWSGTWKGVAGRSTLKVTAPSADDGDDTKRIEVKYCFEAWCMGGCTKEPCGWHANKVHDLRYEEGALKFKTRKGNEFVFTRQGPGLSGLYKGQYKATMKRRRE